jgi:thioredoxin 1
MTTTHATVPAVTTTTFDELIASAEVPVVVDFWATWCGPCVPMAEALATVAEEQAGRMLAASVDVDDQVDLARRYGVQSMPTLLVFQDGEVIGRIVGARGAARLREDLSGFVDWT